jgi:hypothetical protein
MRFSILYFIICHAFALQAQEVYFSPLELSSEKGMTYDIIGRVGKQIWIYKAISNQHSIAVYNDSMQLVKKAELKFLPRELAKVDFINLGEEVHLFFQHVNKEKLYFSAARFNSETKLVEEPIVLDSLLINDPRELRVFRLIANANRSKMMAYSFDLAGPQLIRIKAFLYNRKLEALDKSEMLIASPDGEEMLREFQLDNLGNLIFFRGILNQETELYSRADVLIKPFQEDTVKFASIKVTDIAVRDIRLQVDNANNKIIAAALYGAGRKYDISGVFSITIDINNNEILAGQPIPFSDSLRDECRMKNIPARSTFNDYLIDEIIPFKAGGYALLIERRASEGNRFSGSGARFYTDNMLPPSIVYNGLTGNAPIFSTIRSPYDPFRQPIDPKSFIKNLAGNLLLISMDETGNMADLQMLRKEQVEENSSDLISYTTIRTPKGLRFLFNEKEKGGLTPNVVAFTPGNRLKRIPTFKIIPPNYRLLMRKAIQTATSESVIPCISNSFISFGRVEF